MNEELLEAIMYLLVGVAVLLVGMRFMSGGLKKMAGKGLRRFFKRTQNNPFLCMGMGIVITILIQSSDATSALVIGFINAGAMQLEQGLAIMLGGYIGTTVTGVLASFASLPISVYLLSLAFIGVVMMMFFHNEKVKNIGEILCGLGLLFFGLAVMKDAFSNEDMNAACVTMFSAINFPPLLFLIGVLLTALAQSSSAITGITIAMVGGGALDLSSALYIALGATLGTVATTLLASMSGNIEGKRAATTAFAMRALSSVVALVILWIFETPITEFLHLMAINGSDQFPVAMFTVIYNVIFMPLMIPLIKPFTKLFTRILKDKKASEFADAVQYIDDRLLKSPEIALMQARKEIVHMFDLAETNYHNGFEKILNYSDEKTKEIINIEGQVDYLNARITDFLIKLAPLLQTSSEVKVGAYFHVINDIERIGDHAFNFHEAADAMNQEDLSFSETAKKEIKELDAVVTNMFKIAREIFINKDRSSLTVLRDQEEDTHRMKQDFYQHHYDRILAEQCSTKMTPYISSFIVELERVADHLTNIGYSIVRPTGDTMEATSPEDAKKLKRKAKAAE